MAKIEKIRKIPDRFSSENEYLIQNASKWAKFQFNCLIITIVILRILMLTIFVQKIQKCGDIGWFLMLI